MMRKNELSSKNFSNKQCSEHLPSPAKKYLDSGYEEILSESNSARSTFIKEPKINIVDRNLVTVKDDTGYCSLQNDTKNSDMNAYLSASFKLSKMIEKKQTLDENYSLPCSQPINKTLNNATNWSISSVPKNKNSFHKTMFRSHSLDSLTNLKSISSKKILHYDSSKKCFPSQYEWDNPVLGSSNQISLPSTLQPKLLARKSFNKIYSSFSFTKNMLSNVKVLGQIDNKFIACVFQCNNNLVLVDQHAAHERIRLEKLLNQIGYYSTSKSTIKNSKTRLSPPLLVNLFEKDFYLLKHYQKEFEDIGLKFTASNKTKTLSLFKVYISTVPSVFVNACEIQCDAKGAQINSNLIKEFILEQISIMRSSKGQMTMSSVTVFKVLASYACHGAIKFGDPLSHATCIKLIKQLSYCSLPFQCAHGRPSIAPLLKLNMLHDIVKQNVNKPNLKRLKTLMEDKKS